MISSRTLFLNHLAQTSPAPMSLEIEKAEGVYLFDQQGKKYIDLISGIAVSNIGHCHPKVIEAIRNQTEKYLHLMVYGEYVQSPQTLLAEKLIALLPKTLSNTYFVNSGSEANEGALKLAKRHTKRSKIVAAKKAYHGSTHGALSLMSEEYFKTPFRPLLNDVHYMEFNNFSDLDVIDNQTACVILEPIQAEAGVIKPIPDYLKKVRQKCNETGALLIFDEIQTGMGRTGSLFAFEQFGIVPDILTLGKAFGGGMPLAAFISSKEIMSCLIENPVLGHITTFGGHPVCCAAALAALEVILEEKLVEQMPEKETLFRKYFQDNKKIKEFRQVGLMMAIDLGDALKMKKVVDEAIQNGIIIDWFLFNENSIRMAPPLTIKKDEIMHACEIILSAIDHNC